uniref:Hexosyltransferase n=1 Tax=Nelumbo nucifera TaxID=4432 RepID=A0A822Y5G1_NELNU|nr:TPA_asm: hypothetical protein HUJ06_029165 [Nelumbo nucifera]
MKTTTARLDRRQPSPRLTSFALSTFFLIVFLCALASINGVRFEGLLNMSYQNTTSPSNASLPENSTSAAALPELRVLIGIPTLPDQYHRRHFLRMVYGTQSPVGAQVDIKFVFCNLTKEDQTVLVALEIMRYDDIIILNCKENMNNVLEALAQRRFVLRLRYSLPKHGPFP